jgi:hypothetical protein
MRARRTYILAGLLVVSSLCRAQSPRDTELTAAEYRAQLEQLLVATQQLDSSERPVPPLLKQLPPRWRLSIEQRDFEVSSEGLQRDVRRFEQEKSAKTASAVRGRIQSLIADLVGFQGAPQDTSRDRERLNSILARPEFRSLSNGPGFLDRLGHKLIDALVKILEFFFRSSAIPTIGKFFVYGLIGLAVLTLAYIAYRQIKWSSEQEKVIPADLPVSARDWSLWLAQAQAAAAQHNWREAIHLAYWAGISFLELRGAWRPDRARTPREYLRLLSTASEHREPLTTLTRMFELAWYAKREADANSFSQMLQALERLGCQPS